jgi:hypothetical protein
MLMLECLQPTRVHVPFHSCNAVLEPFRKLNIPVQFYGLDKNLAPTALPALDKDEYLLWTNFYGICGTVTERLKAHYGNYLLIDDTHNFFHGNHPGNWSFTSARKYFGVPDGAYLYSPRPLNLDVPRFDDISMTHLALRALGEQANAYEAYVRYERALPCAVLRMSAVSEALMTGVDLDSIALARRRNFAHLHRSLASTNTLSVDMPNGAVPFCYPYLPGSPFNRKSLHDQGLFIPTLWPDVLERDVDGFEFDKRLSAVLLPLPIDHRYGPAEMDRLIDPLLAK